MLEPYAAAFAAPEHRDHLALWHGFGLPLALSALSIGLGLVLFWQRQMFSQLQAALSHTLSAERAYQATMQPGSRPLPPTTSHKVSNRLPR